MASLRVVHAKAVDEYESLTESRAADGEVFLDPGSALTKINGGIEAKTVGPAGEEVARFEVDGLNVAVEVLEINRLEGASYDDGFFALRDFGL